MDIEQLKALIKEHLLNSKGKLISWAATQEWVDSRNLNYLIKEINNVVPNKDLNVQVDLILRFGKNIHNCQLCGQPIKIEKKKDQYLCRSCIVVEGNKKRAKTNKEVYGYESHFQDRKKMENRLFEKYGVDNVSKSDLIKEKRKRNNKTKYGVNHHMQSDHMKNHFKEINQEKYGVESFFLTKEFKEKKEKTNQERYGAEHHMKNEKFKKYGNDNYFSKERNKVKDAVLEKYGVDNVSKSDLIKEKRKKTNLERYGVDNVSKSDLIKEKVKNSMILNHGFEYAQQNEEVKKRRIESYKRNYWEKTYSNFSENQIELINNPEILYKEHSKNKLSPLSIAKKYGFSRPFIIDLFESNGFEILNHGGISQEQIMLAEKIRKRFGVSITECDRKIISPKEIDIYIPSYNLGIEYHGTYWHQSKQGKTDLRHREKAIKAYEAGINLLQFFDYEVFENEEIVMSMIGSRMGFSERIFARKCEIETISPKQYKDFCEQNHIQGYAPASIKIGLFFRRDLVGVMGLSKPRFSKNSKDNIQYELVRYCTKLNHTIVGGFSKSLKFFENQHGKSNIISYCDSRYSVGNVYKQNGFEFIRHTPPNYWYINPDTGVIESRQKYQKHKLKHLLEDFDPLKTEKQNMIDHGFRCIYDAGHLVYHYDKPSQFD